jgi:phosphopantetheinyl transferase
MVPQYGKPNLMMYHDRELPIFCQTFSDLDLRIYYIYPEPISRECLRHYESLLDLRSRQRLLNMERESDQKNLILGRLLLIKAANDLHKNMSLKELSYVRGKPLHPQLKFNISHTDSLVCLVVSQTLDVGIDCETIQSLDCADFQYCFSDQEWLQISSALDPMREFIRLWTRKEAALKALGYGLIEPLSDFVVLEDDFIYQGVQVCFKEFCPEAKHLTTISYLAESCM